jgi:hypothetical protein
MDIAAPGNNGGKWAREVLEFGWNAMNPSVLARSAGIAVLALAVAAGARAGLLVDTGPGPGAPGGIGGWRLDSTQFLAGEFQLSSPATITGADIWAETYFGAGGELDVSLFSGGPAGSLLGGGSTTVPAGDDAGWFGVSGLDISVPAGTYWVDFSTPVLGWGDTPTSFLAGPPLAPVSPLSDYQYTNGGFWNDYPGLDIGVQVYGISSVPDCPGTSLMLACGLIGLGALASRRSRWILV